MNCKETGEVLHGYLDGELDLTRSLALERHLEDCPVCARAHRERQTLRTALAERSLYFEAPKDLERRVRSALRLIRPTAPRADRPRRHWNWRCSASPRPAPGAGTAGSRASKSKCASRSRRPCKVRSPRSRTLRTSWRTSRPSILRLRPSRTHLRPLFPPCPRPQCQIGLD